MKFRFLLTALAFAAISCIQEPNFDLPIEQIDISSFEFNNSELKELDFEFTDKNGDPFRHMLINIYDANNANEGDEIFKFLTDTQGRVNAKVFIPLAIDDLLIEVRMISIPRYFELKRDSELRLIYKGFVSEEHSIRNEIAPKSNGRQINSVNANAPVIKYKGSYSSNGVPHYLESTNDLISAQLLNTISASLPESQPVPGAHPTYLADGKQSNIEIIDSADVWVTFVHEGAGWRNAIAFYTYPTGSPPFNISEIDTLTVIFPNLSFQGSGGGLQSGNKIHLGVFQPGTSIGLALLADGWDGNNSNNYKHLVFSNKELNPETDPQLKQHNVLLYDDVNKLFILGFEDVRRDNIPFNCDQDFNDAILFFTSNPITAIETNNVNPIDDVNALDSDGDGVNNVFDEFPNDPELAYNSYFPNSTAYATLAFEDNWPNYGDYDFNDAVIDYQYHYRMNSRNQIVDFEIEYVLKALGAGYRNGFGLSLDLNPSDIKQVGGYTLNQNIIQLSGNGTESGQSKAVLIVSDNLHDEFGLFGMINTETGMAANNVSKKMTVILENPKSQAELGYPPNNPFLIVDGERGREVHLPSHLPTDLADPSYFGTSDDLGNGQYYKSKTDLPWALNIPLSFDYPKEKEDIRSAHLHFSNWVYSFGSGYTDWYRDLPAYRNQNKIYTKP